MGDKISGITKMVQFDGTYKHDKDENFEAVLEKAGIGYLTRKMASKAKPTIEVKVEGDTWTIITTLPIKTMTWNFKLGEEVELEGPEGKAKMTFTLEGDKLIQNPSSKTDAKSMMVERHFTEEGLKQTMTHLPSGTVGSRFFKRS